MSSDTEGGWTATELRRMDEQTARQTLPVAQYERWEDLQALDAQAEDTRERWAAETQQVHDLTVHADPDALGTEVDLYGNDVLVHLDTDDPEFRAIHEEYQGLVSDDPDPEELEANREELADAITELLDCLILRWNGHDWQALEPERRRAVLADARAKWGFDNLVLGWAEVMAAIQSDREDSAAVVESFRGAAGRGGR